MGGPRLRRRLGDQLRPAQGQGPHGDLAGDQTPTEGHPRPHRPLVTERAAQNSEGGQPHPDHAVVVRSPQLGVGVVGLVVELAVGAEVPAGGTIGRVPEVGRTVGIDRLVGLLREKPVLAR